MRQVVYIVARHCESCLSEGGRGYSCIAEQRMIETIQSGKPSTSFLKAGDKIEIEMRDAKNHSIFGRIEQDVVKV